MMLVLWGFFFFFFLNLLKEVKSSLWTYWDCLASLNIVGIHVETDTTTDQNTPKKDKTKNNMSKGKEPISPKTPMVS